MRFYLQLSKVNSVTLMAWLKSRGLQCKSKDKKPELVAKVLCALNVRISEQWIEENKEISESALCWILLQSNCIFLVCVFQLNKEIKVDIKSIWIVSLVMRLHGCLVGILYMYLSNVKYISPYMVGRLDKTKVDKSENQNRYLKLSIVLY